MFAHKLDAVFEKLVSTFYMTWCILNKCIAEWLAIIKRSILRIIFGGLKLMKIGESEVIKN
jgi:hypothetical protein